MKLIEETLKELRKVRYIHPDTDIAKLEDFIKQTILQTAEYVIAESEIEKSERDSLWGDYANGVKDGEDIAIDMQQQKTSKLLEQIKKETL